MTQQNERLGGAPTPAEPVIQKSPSRKLNVQRNSITAAERQEKHRRVASNMYEIEGDVYDLVNMTRIMADLFSSELREVAGDENCVTIKIGRHHWDMVNFAVNDCVVRANEFRKKFVAGIGGGAA